MASLFFASVVFSTKLHVLECLVFVVASGRAVFVALTVFVSALRFQEAFGMTALTQMGELAVGIDETAGSGAVVSTRHLCDSGTVIAAPTVPGTKSH